MIAKPDGTYREPAREAHDVRECQVCGGRYDGFVRYAGLLGGPLSLCPTCCLELADRTGIDLAEVSK